MRHLPSVLVLLLGAAGLAAAGPGDGGAPLPHGVDTSGIDRAVAAGDDFYAHANGAWERAVTIPADRASWGTFAILGEKTAVRLRELCEKAATAPAGSTARLVGDAYATLMDEAAIEARGLSSIKPTLARYAKIKDRKGLSRVLGDELRADVDPLNNAITETERLFGLWIAPDLNTGETHVPYLLQGGLGLPDRDYYSDPSERMQTTRAAYRAHVAALFGLARFSDVEMRADRVLALETEMAKVHASREDTGDITRSNNPWPRADLARRAPGLDWNVFLGAAGLAKAPTFIIWQPAGLTGLSALVASQPLDAWKDWLAYHELDRRSPVLPRAFADEYFAFHGKTLAGTPQLADRWKRAVNMTSDLLGGALGQLYVAAYFPAESKAQVQEMVKNIIAAFRARVDRLAWMTPETRARAKEKLGTLYVGIGYPDRVPSLAGLKIVRGDAVGNADRGSRFELKQSLARLGKPMDRTEWSMVPQTVNAVNLPLQNALNFPAAILQPPYFDPAAPAAVNYGAIGAVIGHEISHSFDDTGAQFDAKGRYANWWTPPDLEHFNASSAQLVAQYDAYQPFPDLHINGRLTLGENIADLAGLAAAHDAWEAATPAEARKGDGTFTGDQLFFLAYGQVWRAAFREPELRKRVLTNGHSPGRYRTYTVRNLDAWYTAFGVKAGQKLYLAPKDRITIW